MRGRGRRISTVLADALRVRDGARPAVLAAAFAEACGHPLCREASLKMITREGVLIAVARTPEWATQLEALTYILCERVNARLGKQVATGLQVRVGPLRG
ncbi:MAG TPA: DciA family protein [Anaeromyxobacteraceae bacterium]|nr:DciA family protein [Anaeromyxobacteraceae bacterium]